MAEEFQDIGEELAVAVTANLDARAAGQLDDDGGLASTRGIGHGYGNEGRW
jgi:hypothetical protein